MCMCGGGGVGCMTGPRLRHACVVGGVGGVPAGQPAVSKGVEFGAAGQAQQQFLPPSPHRPWSSILDGSGRELAKCGKGQCFGELALLENKARCADGSGGACEWLGGWCGV